jgi:uncharacterized repeat protein (TIGR01451 family)
MLPGCVYGPVTIAGTNTSTFDVPFMASCRLTSSIAITTSDRWCPNSTVYTSVVFENNGDYIIPASTLCRLVFSDNTLGLVTSSVSYTSPVGGIFEWLLPADLLPNTQTVFNFTFNLSGNPGDAISLESSMPGFNCANNISVPLHRNIACSYDPNDKSVYPQGCGAGGLITENETLQYTIRFQNMGNAPAYDIVVKDQLAAALDYNTFELLATSHALTGFSVDDLGMATFTFADIMLPDKVSDPLGSQGFIIYSLKPRTGLPAGTQIGNSADIYFDSNDPVTTNNTLSTVGPLPVAAAGANSPVCEGATLDLFAEGGVTYAWDGPLGFASALQDPSVLNVTTAAAGTYTVTATDAYGCTASASCEVMVNIFPGTWLRKSDFGGAGRIYSVGFGIGNKGYIGTGLRYQNFGPQTYYKDFWEYDPATNAWTQKADFGGGLRCLASGFSIGTKGYVAEGDGYGIKNDLWEFDPQANTWTMKTACGGGGRMRAVGFSIGNKGYLGTGANCCGFLKDFWEYDPSVNAWTQKADFGGTVRHYAVGFGIGNKGYVGTGDDYTGHRNDFWEYDPAANVWIQKANFGGSPREHATGFSIGTKGYIGISGGNGFENDFWEYDPATDQWTKKANFTGDPRYAAVGFSIGNKGYVGVGAGYSDFYSDFWQYTPGDGFTAGSNSPVFTGNTLELSASGGVLYNWSGPDGFYSVDQNPSIPDVTVSAMGTYSVTVTDANGCTASAGVEVIVNDVCLTFGGLSELLSPYTILARTDLRMKRTTVYSGGVGVQNDEKGYGNLEVKEFSDITYGGTFARSNHISVDNSSQVAVIDNTPASVPFPVFEGSSFTSTLSVTVPPNQTVYLDNVNYKEIKLGKNATAVFTKPELNILKKLKMENGSSLQFDQCTYVHLLEGIEAGEKIKINPSEQYVVFYAGGDIKIKGGAQVTGAFYLGEVGGHSATDTTYHHMHIEDSKSNAPAVFKGMFLAECVHSGKYTSWFHEDFCSHYCAPGLRRSIVEQTETVIDGSGILLKNFPNPFNNKTTVIFKLPADNHVVLEVYDVAGNMVQQLFNGDANGAQEYAVEFNSDNLPAGVYVTKLTLNDNVLMGKMTLIRK